VNFTRDVLDRCPPGQPALIERARDGTRREWTFAEVSERSARLAGTLLGRGVRGGDVVMTLIGNRPDWVVAMCACFRIGAVALPCTEQLRAKDLRLRLAVARPSLIIADEGLFAAEPAQAVALTGEDPCLITFTSGTSGEPKAVLHGQRYLCGQRLQTSHWLGARAGELVWCTASSGWSKSARNVFIAPWLAGAGALLADVRFDPEERLELLASERVNVLCMAPTEYRVIAKRTTLRALPDLRGMVAAGEALNPEVQRAWREVTGLDIRDGYGQTETGQLTGSPPDRGAPPGSMGKALPGVGLTVRAGELIADPRTVPTFFLGYLGEGVIRDDPSWRICDRRGGGPWPTGDHVREDADGYLWFEGRTDDVIISAGYRIGPFEVESALVAHPAVAEAAAVAAPDEERGAVVRAVVVLRPDRGYSPSAQLARELQEHVKSETAPYKYPRIIDFARELPKTATGKVMRAALRTGAFPAARDPD
jgi:acetyl-CoA synthetase